MPALIYKIVAAGEWADAISRGVFEGSAVDIKDGFIHFSAPHQVRETAARHFAGQYDLLLVAFDAERLGPALKWEASRGGHLFPHLYVPLDPALAASAEALPVDAAGRHVFPKTVP
jgi:uncharacterized protein (DUF952 family)